MVLALLVLSHWVLDVITHRPDMPVTVTGDRRLGLGLWNSLPATMIVELILFAIGIAIYQRTTTARDKTERFAFTGLVVFLLTMYFLNLFGPPPPNEATVAWGYWIDRHRSGAVAARQPSRAEP